MSQEGPLLGSAYLRNAPSTPSGVENLTPSLCSSLSAFKSLLASYRKLDDSIMLRLNRSHALAARDPRISYSETATSECEAFYTELLQIWKGREQAIDYCTKVQDEVLIAKRKEVFGDAGANSDPRLDREKQGRDALYAEEVKKQQISRELQVESIVRKRTLDAFFTRCRNYIPPALNQQIEQASQPRPST